MAPRNFLCFVILLLVQTQVFADELNLGFQKQVDPEGVFGTTIRSRVLRSTLFTTLLVPRESASSPGSNFGLRAASDLSVNPSGIRFMLRPALTFEDSSPITTADVLYSLTRCNPKVANNIDRAANGSILISRDSSVSEARSGAGPDSVLRTNDQILQLLSTCPIIPKSSSRFGTAFGFMNSVVASGTYAPVDQPNSTSLQLARSGRSVASKEQPASKITLLEYTDQEKMLSTLRMGSLDAAFTTDAAILDRARLDQTLRVSKCDSTMLIFRRGLTASCEPRIELDTWYYREEASGNTLPVRNAENATTENQNRDDPR